MDGSRDFCTEQNRQEIYWAKRQRQVCDITYMWNLKKRNDTNELVYKTEIESLM